METRILRPLKFTKVKSRLVHARAVQFRYFNDRDETIRCVRMIEAAFGICLDHSYDPQSGTAYFIRQGHAAHMLGDGEWIVLDSFKRVSILPDVEFKTYFEPEK